MKIGVISSSTFGKYTFQDFLKSAVELGFQSFELPALPDSRVPGMHQNTLDVSLGNLTKLKKEITSYGLEICAVGCWNDFVQFDEEAMAREVKRVKESCDIAQFFECSVVRVFGTLRNGRPKTVIEIGKNLWIDSIIEGFKRCVDYAESAGVYLALENHGTITNDVDIELKIIKEVDSQYLRKNVDVSNYLWRGHDIKTVHRFLKKIAPYTAHTHLKNGTAKEGIMDKYIPTTLGEGEIDIEYFIKELKACNYQGPFCIEYEGQEDPRIGCTKSLDFLKGIISKL